MKIRRHFTRAGRDVFQSVEWTRRASRITNPDGSVVFEMKDAEVPASWSQLATDIMVSKYFRKAGVPQPPEGTDPIQALREGATQKDEHGRAITGPEKSARQVIHRLAGCWKHWGQKHGYFDTAEDAQAFYDELAYMLLEQVCAPNSPQWFNTGLNWAYGIGGPPQGHWVVDPATGEAHLASDAYTHPQPHACFIQSVEDDLVSPGGIMDLWTREARLFKYGSGTGTNFSRLRGENEPLSGGGKSSGLMSWLKIGDRAAGAIKSGGTTRRAAKMVCLDLDHPDIEAFVNWKVREEIKVAALVEGMKHLTPEQKDTARKLALDLDYDFNGEAYLTVSGQNSNNSVRIPNEFFKRLDENGSWELKRRTDGKIARRLSARELWNQIAYAAWRCADPGVQFDTTVNEWHTCPASGRINASNPCSEYMFLDNTACNLASFNLLKFYDPRKRSFDVAAYEHAIELWTIVLEISVLMAAFPSKEIARLSYEYRTLGLGYANIGALLMQAGIPYDSEEARAVCGALTAILTGRSYATSAQLAAELGPFPGYYKNREHMLRVIRNHRRAAYGVPHHKPSSDRPFKSDAATEGIGDYEGLEIRPVPIEARYLDTPRPAASAPDSASAARPGASAPDSATGIANSPDLLRRARAAWDDALKQGNAHGYRNAQTTVIAPTGTIGLLMDCDTTGVEPDFALVKFKKLAGGGYFKIANQSLKPALEALGYEDEQIADILRYVLGSLSLDVPMPDNQGSIADSTISFAQYLKGKGLTDTELAKVNDSLGGAMEISFALNAWTLGPDAVKRLGVAAKGDVLKALGLRKKQIARLNELVCGTATIEGAPHLRPEHLAVFDCANKCGKKGRRFIAPDGHIRMMAAAQPFISGAISKTINLPGDASVEDIQQSYRLSWELGLKANALYRDGCKLSQPLNSTADADGEAEDEEGIEAGKAEVACQVVQAAQLAATAAGSGAGTAAAATVERIVERIIERPMRRRLPDTRQSLTHKFNVAGHEGYITVGLYEDGQPGELFITMAKEGSTVGGLMDSLGTAISIALQYGVPTESLVNKFTHQRFEPAGMTHNPDIPFAKSLVDYIFRWMGMEFVQGYRAANAPRRGKQSDPLDAAPAAPATSAVDKVEAIVKPAPRPASSGNGNGHALAHEHDHHRSAAMVDPPRRPVVVDAIPISVAPTPSAARARSGAAAKPAADTASASLATAMREMQADAPACDVCGTITVRSGTCYKCVNCGNSMGCS